jgi:hypothetical protein
MVTCLIDCKSNIRCSLQSSSLSNILTDVTPFNYTICASLYMYQVWSADEGLLYDGRISYIALCKYSIGYICYYMMSLYICIIGSMYIQLTKVVIYFTRSNWCHSIALFFIVDIDCIQQMNRFHQWIEVRILSPILGLLHNSYIMCLYQYYTLYYIKSLMYI